MKISPLVEHMNFLGEIAKLHHAEWGHLNPSNKLENRIASLEKLARREGIPVIYIAHADNKFIGSAALVEQDMPTLHPELSPWLAAVFVKEQWRGQGIATRLVKHCEAQAIAAGIEKLFLFTESASELYKALGWQEFESCTYKGAQVQVMYKELAI